MKDILNKLNLLLADLQVERANIQAAHWNMKGCPSFLPIHQYFDVLYAANGAHIDMIAEFIRIYRGVPIVSLSKYVRRSTIIELTQDSDYDIHACINKAFIDAKVILSHLNPLFDATTEQLDIGDYMATMTADYGKRLWFLRSSMMDKQEKPKMEASEEASSEED